MLRSIVYIVSAGRFFIFEQSLNRGFCKKWAKTEIVIMHTTSGL